MEMTGSILYYTKFKQLLEIVEAQSSKQEEMEDITSLEFIMEHQDRRASNTTKVSG